MAGTEALDAVSRPLAEAAGVPLEQWATAIGDEFLALALEVPAGFIFPTLGKELVYLAAGVGFMAARMTAYKSGRAAEDTAEFAGHFLNRSIAIALDPVTATALASDIAKLKAGDMSSLIRSPTDIQSLINQLITAYQQIVGVPAGVAAFRPAGVPLPMPSAGVATPLISSGQSMPGYAGIGGVNGGGGVLF